jgi:signal transduction histidine kinase
MEDPKPAPVDSRWRVRRFDLVVAVGIGALTQRDLWVRQDVVGLSRVALAAVFCVATSALVWRRSAAFVCATLLGLGLVAEAAISGGNVSSSGWALAGLVGLYSAGAYLELRRALAALAVLVAGLASRELRDLGSYARDPYQGAFWWLFVAAAFGIGVYVRSRRQAAALRRVAVRSEIDSAENARAAVAEERARIARELHDVLAHEVSAVVLQAEAAEEMLIVKPERARESLHTIQRLGREALGEMRQALEIIRSDGSDGVRAPQPMLADLPALIERNRAAELSADLRIEGAQRLLPPGLEVSAYRVVQEALTNVRKHAHGASASVTLRYESSSLQLEITDDGAGAATTSDHFGHGLIGMRERVNFFGGHFTAGPVQDGGFTVWASFPTPPAAG